MSSKKLKNQPIENLPFDCWCHLILFLSKPKDLLNLVCTIKGLYNYIKRVSPQCTKNVVFSLLGKLPSRKFLHVSNLKCSSRVSWAEKASVIEYLDKIGCESTNSLVDQIFCSFKTLRELFMDLDHSRMASRMHSRTNAFLVNFSQLSVEGSSSTLTILRVHIYSCHLVIDNNFPRLKTLELVHDTKEDDGAPTHATLGINFSRMKALKTLELYRFFVHPSTEFSEIKAQIEYIKFFDTTTPNFKAFPPCPNLRELVVRAGHTDYSLDQIAAVLKQLEYAINVGELKYFSSISGTNFPKLEELRLWPQNNPQAMFPDGSVFEIESFHALKLLWLDLDERKESIGYRLKDLPKLKNFQLRFATKEKIFIPDPSKDIPSLEVLEIQDCNFDAAKKLVSKVEIWKDTLQTFILRTEVRDYTYTAPFHLGFRDFTKLKTVYINRRNTPSSLALVNCPALESVDTGMNSMWESRSNDLNSPIGMEMSGLSSLRKMHVYLCEDGVFPERVLDLLKSSGVDYLEELTVSGDSGCCFCVSANSLSRVKNLVLEGLELITICDDESSEENRLEKIAIDSTVLTEIGGLANLEEVEIDFKKEVTIMDCPKLNKVVLRKGSFGLFDVHLENLPKCETFSLTGKGHLSNLTDINVGTGTCARRIDLEEEKKDASDSDSDED